MMSAAAGPLDSSAGPLASSPSPLASSPGPLGTYEEKRQELSLLERLTSEVRLQMTKARHLIQAPSVQASADGILVSKILGVFLFLFLLVGMLLFFHKETNCGAEWHERLKRAARWLRKAVRRKFSRFDRQWSCEEDSSQPDDSSGPGIYRAMSDSDTISVEPADVTFNHRQALLELFADLELHHEVVRHSLRGYDAALSRLDGRARTRAESTQMSPQARAGAVKVAPLPGVLRVPTAALGGRTKHRHHHHHKHRRCGTIAEENHHTTSHNTSDVTARSSADVTLEMQDRGMSGAGATSTPQGLASGAERVQSDSGYSGADESDNGAAVQRCDSAPGKQVTAV